MGIHHKGRVAKVSAMLAVIERYAPAAMHIAAYIKPALLPLRACVELRPPGNVLVCLPRRLTKSFSVALPD